MRKFLLAITLVLVFAATALATPITFSGSSGSLAAEVVFNVSGSNLLVTLTNTSTTVPNDPADILTGVVFNISGDPLLGRTSAILHSGSSVVNDPDGQPAGGVVGGEWAYINGLSQYSANQAIYSAGYFDGENHWFPGAGLEPPDSVDGVQYGITTSNYTAGSGNGGIKNSGLIKYSVDFTLSGLPVGFSLSSISNVTFQYGTALSEPHFQGHGGNPVPEPSTVLLLGSALLGLSAYKLRKRRK